MIADAIKQARQMHRDVIEQAYDGTCTIYVQQEVTDPVTKLTVTQEEAAAEQIPCRLSFSSSPATEESDTTATAAQTIKLFLAPEREIPPGCRIEVNQNGRTESYTQSGKAAVYFSHQEITLELWKGWT